MTAGWQLRAACRGHDPDMWFDDDEASVEAAKAICNTQCPVRNECAVAGKDEDYGIFGGIEAIDRLSFMLLATPGPPPHVPSRSCYTSGCREPECRQINTEWMQKYDRKAAVTRRSKVDLGEKLDLTLESA